MSDKSIEFTDEEALQKFLLDIECLDELLPWTGKFNLFDVLKISRTEIRHSNMLAWLLNANENHSMGDLFIKGIIQRLVENNSEGRYDVFQTLLMDLYSFSVFREWRNIDILLVSDMEKTLIAIENKVGASEHSDQLKRYRKILEKEYSEYNKICIFLTPNGDEPSDIENWGILTYSDVVEVLESLYTHVELQSDVALMMKHYIDVIRRDIVEDKHLIEICNKIYNKHKRALDLIYEHRIDDRAQIVEMIRNTLRELTQEGKIIYSDENNSSLVFHTKNMNEYLKPLSELKSSWGTVHIYNFWIAIQDTRFYGIYELGGWNVPENEMEHMQKIIDVLQPKDKRRNDFRYKRVYRTKWFNIEEIDNMEEELPKLVRAAIDEILKMEKELLIEVKKIGIE